MTEQLCFTQVSLTSFSFPWIQAADLHCCTNGEPTCHPLLTSWFYLNPFQPWPTSAVSGSGSAATTALCSIGLMPMMALPQTENYARGFQVQMYFPHCQFAATERKASLFCKKIQHPRRNCEGEGGTQHISIPRPNRIQVTDLHGSSTISGRHVLNIRALRESLRLRQLKSQSSSTIHLR